MWKYRGQQRPAFAQVPRPGQESVWDYPRPPAVSRDPRHVTVRAGSRLLADSRAALRVMETASPPTFYIPAGDIDLGCLLAVTGRSVCEWKGGAQYWALREDAERVVIAWSYPQPAQDYAVLKDHFAFYPALVDCFVDGEHVQPQPGQFYGGWVTAELTGPFKGEPGTGHW